MEPALPRGVRDVSSKEAMLRRQMVRIIENTFQRFGFLPMDTPAIETLDVLNAKAYGDEAKKEIYTLDGEKSGLRFDLTVPLARYIAMNRSMPMPFKRYQIGTSWRKEEPQKMRYREFLQADVDIVGSSGVYADAEVVAAAASAIERIGVSDYSMLINSRKILDFVLTHFGVPENLKIGSIRIIDKLAKQGRENVVRMLADLGLSGDACNKIIDFISNDGSNEQKISSLESIGMHGEQLSDLLLLLGLLEKYSLKGKIVLSMSLARGMDYYTGFIWEFTVPGEDGGAVPTIAAGGRYDKLIGLYSKSDLSATGASIGVDRVFDIVYRKDVPVLLESVYIANVSEEDMESAVSLANEFRSAGACADINTTQRGISKQLEYANAMHFHYAVIMGKQERESGKIRLKDLITGKEELLEKSDALNILLANSDNNLNR